MVLQKKKKICTAMKNIKWKISPRMGENICKWSDQQGIIFKNIETAHAVKKKKKSK